MGHHRRLEFFVVVGRQTINIYIYWIDARDHMCLTAEAFQCTPVSTLFRMQYIEYNLVLIF